MRREPPKRILVVNAFFGTLLVIAIIWSISVAKADARPVTPRQAIKQVFGKRSPAALRVALCESRLNPRALGSAGERGLFQIHPVHFSWAKPARLFNSTWNARVAYRLSRGGTNWSHWTCRWAA